MQYSYSTSVMACLAANSSTTARRSSSTSYSSVGRGGDSRLRGVGAQPAASSPRTFGGARPGRATNRRGAGRTRGVPPSGSGPHRSSRSQRQSGMVVASASTSAPRTQKSSLPYASCTGTVMCSARSVRSWVAHATRSRIDTVGSSQRCRSAMAAGPVLGHRRAAHRQGAEVGAVGAAGAGGVLERAAQPIRREQGVATVGGHRDHTDQQLGSARRELERDLAADRAAGDQHRLAVVKGAQLGDQLGGPLGVGLDGVDRSARREVGTAVAGQVGDHRPPPERGEIVQHLEPLAPRLPRGVQAHHRGPSPRASTNARRPSIST